MKKDFKSNLNKYKKSIIMGTTITTILVASGIVCGYNSHKNHLEQLEQLELQRIEEERQNAIRLEEERIARIANNNVAYLTFDDGPKKEYTEKILSVLDENNIKATFFVLGQQAEKYPELIKKIYENGHTIANHTTNHKYVYSSKEEFLEDIRNTDKIISEAIGEEYKSLYVRVPGGSFGKKEVQEAIKEDGRIDLNWTALNGDSERKTMNSKDSMLKRLEETFGDDKYEVVLMHDIKEVTANNLQEIIDYIESSGYIFEKLVDDSPVKL